MGGMDHGLDALNYSMNDATHAIRGLEVSFAIVDEFSDLPGWETFERDADERAARIQAELEAIPEYGAF